jgi:transposase
MEIKFKQGINENQEFLFPRKLSEYLPDSHLAKAINEIVEKLNLTNIKMKYSHLGQHAYDPKTMISLLFYGYSTGVRSSRKISKGCEERFDFAFLSDGLKPSHDRISDFRKDNISELKDIFKTIVLIGANLGLVKLGNIKISIDGAKIKANASPKLTKDEEGLLKLLENTEKEIKAIFEEAEKIDLEEDKKYGEKNRGDELPKKLRSKQSRKAAIEKAYEKLLIQKEEMRKNIEEQFERKPTEAEEKKIEKAKINVTDNDANFMKERNGVIRPNYNSQISVDEKWQFIVANDVTMECTDAFQLVPMLKKTKENIKESPKVAKTDNGYFSQLEKARNSFPEIDLYVDDRNRRKVTLNMKEIKERYSKAKYENLKKLLTKKGKEEYKKRMHTAEPPFGNMKHNLGYRYYLLRGLEKVQGEFNLMCIGHNINKIYNFAQKNNKDMAVAMQDIGKIRGFEENVQINTKGNWQILSFAE